MKKLLILLCCVLFYGCNTDCTLSQIPNQVVYAGANCTAPLPDYKSLVTVTGGCTGFTLTQTPVPGTMLTVTNKTINVILKATGANNKTSQVYFIASLIDTVTPLIVPKTAMVEELLKRSREVYDIGDKMIGQVETIFNNTFPFDSFPGIRKQNSFKEKMLVIISMDSAGTGVRKRVITYQDTVRLQMNGRDTTKLGMK